MKKPAFIYLSGHRFHIAIGNQAWYNVKAFMTKYNVPCFCHPAGHRVAARCLFFFLPMCCCQRTFEDYTRRLPLKSVR